MGQIMRLIQIRPINLPICILSLESSAPWGPTRNPHLAVVGIIGLANYLHIKQMAASDSLLSPVTDYIPWAEYPFRYGLGVEAFRYFPFVSFNRLTRWLLDDFIHTRILYRAHLPIGHASSLLRGEGASN